MLARPLAAFLAVATGFSAGPVDGVAFAPEAGSTVTKTFTEEVSWTLESMEQSADGQSIPQPLPEMSGRVERRTVVTDQYVEVAGGRPLILRRTVDEASGSAQGAIAAEGETDEFEYGLKTELADQTFLFSWNPDEEAFECRPVDGSTGGAELKRLREDLDLRSLLPSAEVAEGDEWTLEAQSLLDALACGGDFDRLPRDFDSEGFQMLDVEDALASSLLSLSEPESEIDGSIRAKWSETTEEDGHKLAVIDLEAKLEIKTDVNARLEQLIAHAGLASQREDTTLAFDWALEGQGQLLWDLEQGRFHSFDLSSDAVVSVELSFTQGGVEIESTFELSGRHELAARAE